MNFSQNKLVVSTRPSEARRPGRPRKWSSDAERMRVKRSGRRQQELAKPEFWETRLQEMGLSMNAGMFMPNADKGKGKLVSGGYDSERITEIQAARERDGLIVLDTSDDEKYPEFDESQEGEADHPLDVGWFKGGGKGKKITPKGTDPNSEESEESVKEPELRIPHVYYLFDPRRMKMLVCNHSDVNNISFCSDCDCMVLPNGLAPFPL